MKGVLGLRSEKESYFQSKLTRGNGCGDLPVKGIDGRGKWRVLGMGIFG